MARCDLNQTRGGQGAGGVPGFLGPPPLWAHEWYLTHAFPQNFFYEVLSSIVFAVSIGLGFTPLGCQSYLTTVSFGLSSSSGHRAMNLSLADLTDRLLAFR